MDLTKFFHRLMNPHCPHCFQEKMEEMDRKECKTCEVLRIELERAHSLIQKLTNTPKQESEPVKSEEELRPIPTNRRTFIPMAVKQQMQDNADKRTLELLIASKLRNELTTEQVSEEKPVDEKKIEEMERDILSATIPEKAVNG